MVDWFHPGLAGLTCPTVCPGYGFGNYCGVSLDRDCQNQAERPGRLAGFLRVDQRLNWHRFCLDPLDSP
jgi:hypothetical protein